MAEVLLAVRGVEVRFGGLLALNAVDLVVEAGSIHALIGPNGAGKTTLLGVISGAVWVQQGQLELQGVDITRLPAHRRAALGVRRTFQHVEIVAGMTVFDTVAVGAHGSHDLPLWQSLLATPRSRRVEEAIAKAAAEALEFVGLASVADREACTLALGQQRLVELARALAGRPRLVLLDEPAAGLNMAETAALGELILRARQAYGLTVVLVEHDMDLVMEVSDQVTVLCFGEVIASASPAEVQRDPRVVAAYLGGST